MRIWLGDEEVAGIQHRMADAKAFAKGRDQLLEFEPEPGNTRDRNAIKVFGVHRGLLGRKRAQLGYVSAATAKEIAARGDFVMLRPRLRNVWWGGHVKDFIVIRFDILEPRPPRTSKRGRT